jgi:hypothetical protein
MSTIYSNPEKTDLELEPHGRVKDNAVISSIVRVTPTRLEIFNHGEKAGELTVREEGVETIICRLMDVDEIDELNVDTY